MIEEHDALSTRCRRLGHEVSFRYCRQENAGKPCRLVLDCWWEKFDVQSFLKEHLAPEIHDEIASNSQPANKIATLFDLIQKARERSESAQSGK